MAQYNQSPAWFDPETERQREMANSLRNQSMTPQQGQMVSGHYVSPGIGAAIAPILQAYASKKIDSRANEQESSRQKQIAQALRTPEEIPAGIRAPNYQPPQLTDRLAGLQDNPQAQQMAMQLRMNEAMKQEQPRLQTTSGTAYGFPEGTTVQVNPQTGQVTPLYQPEAPDFNQPIIMGPNGQPMPNQAYIDAQSQIRAAGKPDTNVNVNTGTDKFVEETAKGDAQRFQDISLTGQKAARNVMRIDQLDDLLQSSPGGLLSQAKMFAGRYGIETEGLDDMQAANALINSMIPEQRPPGSGTMSDVDVAMFRQSLPQLINLPGGNELILKTMRDLNQYDQEIAKIANDALSGRIDRATARDLMMQVPNPLEGFSANIQQAPATDGVDPDLLQYMSPEERALFE